MDFFFDIGNQNFQRQEIIDLEGRKYIPEKSNWKITNKIQCPDLSSCTKSKEKQDQGDNRTTDFFAM